jgi:hypothetical protein
MFTKKNGATRVFSDGAVPPVIWQTRNRMEVQNLHILAGLWQFDSPR